MARYINRNPSAIILQYSFCGNLLALLIIWLIVSSMQPHNLHLLFCCVFSILVLKSFVALALFWHTNWKDSVSLWRFSFFSHIHVFSSEISLVCCLIYPYNSFSMRFNFLVIVFYFYLLTRPKMPSKVMHRKEVTYSNGSYERNSRGRKLADEIGRAKKFPWYTHRLMHRKKVTCELHDSYFRLTTIKHSISMIEWALNYYIAQSRRKSRQLGLASWVAASWRGDVVGKATPGRRGLGPWWIGVQRRCW